MQDSATALDEIYNYGTFEFSPDFYSKFIRGKLLYALSVQSFPEFMYQYQEESRSVQEQDLDLTCTQKNKLYEALRINAQPQNKDYRYDFLFDNCTTRARDIVEKRDGGNVIFNEVLINDKPTFRNLIDIYLNRAHQDWSKLGIDLLLGAKMDRRATNREAMFLPDNLLTAFDNATIDNRPLIKKKQTILAMPALDNESPAITPTLFFSLLLIILGGLSFTKNRWAGIVVTAFDFLLLLVLGAVGLLLLFMWFATNHALCANNYNLLWALPTHIVATFFVHKQKIWVQQYFKIVFVITVVLLAAWAFLPQQMNNAFLPLAVVIALRSYFLSKRKINGSKRT